jgi:spermidine synthase
MNAHKSGWFTEIGAPKGSNVALSILTKKTLHEEQSEFQHIIVFER